MLKLESASAQCGWGGWGWHNCKNNPGPLPFLLWSTGRDRKYPALEFHKHAGNVDSELFRPRCRVMPKERRNITGG